MQYVVQGDLQYVSPLFERYHESLYGYFARVNMDKSLAKDLTQMVFEKLIKYKSSYSSQQCFKAWLFTIARNVNIDHHRKKKYKVVPEDFSIVDKTMGAHQHMVNEENKKKLMLALGRLPEEERELLVMTKFERMKYHQVAKITGQTESALKVRAHRAIKKLRTILVNELNYEY